jgi:PAS domain S-box-containing protein
VALIAVDITDRQNSQEAVRRSEERYRSLVQAGAQVVWVTTPTGEIAEDSPEWRWITGQSAEEFRGSGWLDAIHPEDRDRVERDWRDAISTGKVFDARYRVRTKTGSYRHFDVRAVPIERDGRIVEWVGASTDVTASARPRRCAVTDRAAVRRRAAHRPAPAGHLDAGRGADRRAGRRGDHRGRPVGDRRGPVRGRAAERSGSG